MHCSESPGPWQDAEIRAEVERRQAFKKARYMGSSGVVNTLAAGGGSNGTSKPQAAVTSVTAEAL